MKSPIPIAVVGLGRAGWSLHVDLLRPRTDFQIVDVADPDPARREEAARTLGCGTHSSLDALLEKTTAEIVVTATLSHMHESDVLKILKSKRHCVVEKPMAMSFAGARRLIAAARKARRKLFVHQSGRFLSEFQHLREIIDSGILGRIFEFRTAVFNFARRNDWQTLRRNGGGLLNNTGSHTVDTTLNFLGSPIVSLLGDLQHIKDAGDTEDHVHIFMKARSGQVANITISTACALPAPRWMFLGSCGTLSSDGTTTTLKYYDPKAVLKMDAVDGAVPGRRYGNDDVLPWKEETRPCKPTGTYGNFYDNVAGVLQRGEKMFITPEAAAENVRIIEWARKGTRFPPLKAK